MRKLCRLLLVAAFAGTAYAGPSSAATIVWTVDQSESYLSLAVPDQSVTIGTTTATIQVRNPSGSNSGPWNIGNTAAMGGTLTTDYVEGSSIEFLSGDMFGLVSGNYRPNPAAFNPASTNTANPNGQFTNTTTAPGVFGARVRANSLADAAFFNFTSVDYDIVSTALGISAGSFAANSLTLGIASADVAFDGLSIIFIGQPIADSLSTITGVTGTNTAASGTITAPNPGGDPLLRRLEIPVSLPLVLNLQGTMLNASASGTLVAYAYVVPEPGTLLLLGGGLLALAASRRGPRAH